MEKLTFNDPKLFYVSLAHLFYAVAMADRKFAVEEKKAIIDYVSQYWEFETDVIFSKEIIYETLKELIKNKATSQFSFITFRKFYVENQKKFKPELKKRIFDTVNGIADASAGKNKSELIILNQIYKLIF